MLLMSEPDWQDVVSTTAVSLALSGTLERGAVGKTAPLQEIFSSIQGEGPWVGKRQVFVRFAHCHLKCAYCDTPMQSVDGACHVECVPGSGRTEAYANPLTPSALMEILTALLATARHHSVSLTGGEPLLYHAFLSQVLPALRLQAPVYLETSGTQPDALQALLPWLDYVAMDIKLPSATQEPPQWERHAAFYQVAVSRPAQVQCFVKLVFNDHTGPAELAQVRRIVTDRRTPIILQPETTLSDRRVAVRPATMLSLERALSEDFDDVRVIPQTHKLLNVL